MAAALTEEARKKANLRLLQRSIDSSIEDIVGSATHVVLYEYITPQGWEKSQVEGSLFLVQQQQPLAAKQYSLVILNRHSTENFHVAVTKAFQLQHKEPYLIFKQSPKILGIWFHNANERVVMASLLNQVIENLRNAPIAVPTPPPARPTPPPPLQQQQSQQQQQILQQQTLPPQQAAYASTSVPLQPVPAAGSANRPAMTASPMSQYQMHQQMTTPVSRSHQDHVTSPSQLIEPLMNSLFVSPTSAGAGDGGGGGGAPPDMNRSASKASGDGASSSGGTDTPTRSGTPNMPGVALDKKSLQLALLSLIQDERFIDLLHAQYLKVAHARAHRNNKK